MTKPKHYTKHLQKANFFNELVITQYISSVEFVSSKQQRLTARSAPILFISPPLIPRRWSSRIGRYWRRPRGYRYSPWWRCCYVPSIAGSASSARPAQQGAPHRSCVYCLCNSSAFILLSFRYISLPTRRTDRVATPQYHKRAGKSRKQIVKGLTVTRQPFISFDSLTNNNYFHQSK